MESVSDDSIQANEGMFTSFSFAPNSLLFHIILEEG